MIDVSVRVRSHSANSGSRPDRVRLGNPIIEAIKSGIRRAFHVCGMFMLRAQFHIVGSRWFRDKRINVPEQAALRPETRRLPDPSAPPEEGDTFARPDFAQGDMPPPYSETAPPPYSGQAPPPYSARTRDHFVERSDSDKSPVAGGQHVRHETVHTSVVIETRHRCREESRPSFLVRCFAEVVIIFLQSVANVLRDRRTTRPEGVVLVSSVGDETSSVRRARNTSESDREARVTRAGILAGLSAGLLAGYGLARFGRTAMLAINRRCDALRDRLANLVDGFRTGEADEV